MTKKHKLTKREKEKLKERTPREDYEQVGLQEAPHLQDSKQNHFENAKGRNSKQEFFSLATL
jgi:hypothetical protein